MTNRAGTFVNNLSGEMSYESFQPAPLPPNPPIEVMESSRRLLSPAKPKYTPIWNI